MSELQRDVLHDSWVIIAPGRGDRPRDVRLRVEPEVGTSCPFCAGCEVETPPEVLVVGRPAGAPANGSQWRVRIFPNRYPAVDGAEGRHEVVVLSPDHMRGPADLSTAHLAEVLAAVRERCVALERAPESRSVLFFLNSGPGAGATLLHPHGQLLATPVVPAVLRTELAAIAARRHEHGDCLVCGMVEDAKADGRVVTADAHGTVLTPRASRFCWEMLLVPRIHRTSVTGATADELVGVAGLLRTACRALRTAADDPAYNLVLHTAPPGAEEFHWHLELMPRLAPLAGFETGTGFHINPLRPALAAEGLRLAVQAAREDGS